MLIYKMSLLFNNQRLMRDKLFKYESFEDKNSKSSTTLIINFIWTLIGFYSLYLAFKCKASFTHFLAACCCPPFYIAYVFGVLGGCK
jgi:hypothetical protein